MTAFYRMAVPAALFAIPFLVRRRKEEPIGFRALRWALLGGFLFAFDLALWATGITISGAINPTLLANTAPLWVGLGAMLIFHERLKPLFWFGLGLAMVGAGLVVGQDALANLQLGIGTLLGLGAGMFYGAYFLVTQIGRKDLDAFSYFYISVFSSALILLLINILLGHPLTGYSKETYLSFIALGFVSQGIGWLAINYAQGILPATVVAPTLLAQPVITGFLAIPILGESLNLPEVVGGFWVLLGVYLVHRSRLETSKGSSRDQG